MPYTNPWSNITPAGGDLAGQPGAQRVSAAIRRLKLDIQERMSSIVVDWFADPVTFLPLVSALAATKYFPNPGAEVVVKAVLALDTRADTDVNGRFTINLATLAEVWPISTDFKGCPVAAFWNNTTGEVCFVFQEFQTLTTISFRAGFEDGGFCANDSITGRIIFLFSATP